MTLDEEFEASGWRGTTAHGRQIRGLWEQLRAAAVAIEFNRMKATVVIRNPVTLCILALAILLAPMGVCIGRGHVATATSTATTHHAAGMHSSVSQGHSSHRESGKLHFCADCQPPDYMSAGKAAADAGPLLALAPAFVPAMLHSPPVRNTVPVHSWYGRAPPIPPPLPRATKVRLQI